MTNSLKWIFNEYEFDNRVNNLAWTVAGKYDEDIDISEKDYSSKDASMYYAIIAGAMRKYIDWDVVKKYLANRIKTGYNKDILCTIIQIVLNDVAEKKVIEERPGVVDIRNKAYDDILKNYSKIHKEDILKLLKYTYVLQRMDRHPVMDRLVRKILREINSIDVNGDIMDILKKVDEIYLTYFQYIIDSQNQNVEFAEENIKNVEVDFDTFSDFMLEELYDNQETENVETEINNFTGGMLVDGLGDEREDVDLESTPHRILYVDEEMLNKIYKRVEYYYGKSYLNEGDRRKIEARNCRNVHEGCRLHFTDGVLRSPCDNAFQLKYVTRQKDNNLFEFQYKMKVYRRQINKLRECFSRLLIEESSSDRIYSDCGTIYANKAWRIGRSSNNKIFYKDVDNGKGRYVIDILLDSSGSQTSKQFMVAIQAYILSTALTLAGIPNRVMGFQSFLDYTILKRFRDYNDNVRKCEDIFEYYCSGNNRDGLAIKATCDCLLERDEENKILIVLSDGKPNDVKIGKDSSRSIRGEMSYKGVVGIKDTATEVRRARKRGIMVLGVFTGKEADLEAEKKIYGKDFIYIKDIQRFSDIVSTYLKKVIRN
ncbi:nitric oxide reductase activation-like protein [Intestinibacter sp.]|uniref:nitric oxide reductase activation-like protein n=1 Tax=Intestinibacter sp. TaxID=1965304 RepID=UPI002A9142A6|nr:nitric oxide reductase activation-like protein [Intestinibacter sp.]MDY5213528.1 nitric oxide reductase activation-like protein [Intestinibacter sp.]